MTKQIEATIDVRQERVEKLLRPFIIVAAIAVLPLLMLALTHPYGIWKHVEIGGHWVIWTVFCSEVAIMLSITKDRRAWLKSHRFEVIVVAASSPLLPLALAFAPAARFLIVGKLFKTLKLGKLFKLGKLVKSIRLMHAKLKLTKARLAALVALAGVIALSTLAYMLTGKVGASVFSETVVLVVCGLLLAAVVIKPPKRAEAKS